jgi:hypothetical protein
MFKFLSATHRGRGEETKVMLLINHLNICRRKSQICTPRNNHGPVSVKQFKLNNNVCPVRGRMTDITEMLYQKLSEYPLALMGVLTPGSAHARPSARPPINTTRKYFRCTCLQSHLQTSPPTPQKSYLKFRDPRTTFEEKKKTRTKEKEKEKNKKKRPHRGGQVGGGRE